MNRFFPKKNWLWWIPPLIMMAVIFFMSQMSGPDSSGLSSGTLRRILYFLENAGLLHIEAGSPVFDLLETVLRKMAHASEYALLGGCMVLPLAFHLQKRGKPLFFLALGLTALYACSDELHQLFIPERSCSPIDVGIDTAGACLGILFVLFLLRKKFINNLEIAS